MKNVTGAVVEGENFFGREGEFSDFSRELDNLANLLLVAPRRVGKSSFVIELGHRLRARGRAVAFFNAEQCRDELDFAESLVSALRGEGLQASLPATIEDWFRRARALFRGASVSAGGIDVELGDSPDAAGGTLARVLESILRSIDQSDREIVIAIDELPELLRELSIGDAEHVRVARFLHWLRAVRQTHRERVRWIFLGSVGLDTFVDGRRLRKTINDLTPISLGAFSPEDADRFLEKLGADNGLPVDHDVREAIVARIGWPLPYYLQLAFHQLVQLNRGKIEVGDVEIAIEQLLQPEGYHYFDTWRQRLSEQFERPELAVARAVLASLCKNPQGLPRERLFQIVMNRPELPDAREMEDRLSEVLAVLCRDGYLLESGGGYAFRSFLLREYWQRREVR